MKRRKADVNLDQGSKEVKTKHLLICVKSVKDVKRLNSVGSELVVSAGDAGLMVLFWCFLQQNDGCLVINLLYALKHFFLTGSELIEQLLLSITASYGINLIGPAAAAPVQSGTVLVQVWDSGV